MLMPDPVSCIVRAAGDQERPLGGGSGCGRLRAATQPDDLGLHEGGALVGTLDARGRPRAGGWRHRPALCRAVRHDLLAELDGDRAYLPVVVIDGERIDGADDLAACADDPR
jgi:hypothetical protein